MTAVFGMEIAQILKVKETNINGRHGLRGCQQRCLSLIADHQGPSLSSKVVGEEIIVSLNLNQKDPRGGSSSKNVDSTSDNSCNLHIYRKYKARTSLNLSSRVH